MTTSLFRIFRSSDIGAPVLYGTTGSIVSVLDYCLITGSGWIKPFPNTSSIAGFPNANSLGCWQQPTGSSGSGSAGMSLFINDGAPNATSLYKEAWATGYESCTGSNFGVATSVGAGSGQFPLPAQSLTQGKVVIRKSATSDVLNSRAWIVAADSSSFYLFIGTGDVASTYYAFGFGDIFSYKTSNDAYRCIIMGRSIENSTAAANEGMDLLSAMSVGTTGTWMPRSYTTLGTSITASKHGDGVKGSTTTLLGSVAYPNGSDLAYYTSPVWVVEGSTIRGQLRGFYQSLHPIAAFSDQQTLTGSVDYNGKTFLIIKQSANAGVYILETSNTVQTN